VLNSPVFWPVLFSSDAGETRAEDEPDAEISLVAEFVEVSVSEKAPAEIDPAEVGGEVSAEEKVATREAETRDGDA
jgi:hypothetical protein